MKKLEMNEMERIEGGVDRDAYCQTLEMIIVHNDVSPAMILAWYTNCKPYGFIIE